MGACLRAAQFVFLAASASIADDTRPTVQCILEGTVRLGDRPVEGATVILQDSLERTRVMTSTVGGFQIIWPRAGNGTLTVERSTDDKLRLSRIVKTVALQPHDPTRIDIDLQPGTCSIAGVLTRNGLPAPKGSAVLAANLTDGGAYTTCALADGNGEYRLDGLPAGNHMLYLDTRQSFPQVAILHWLTRTQNVAVSLNTGQSLRHDYNLEIGRIVARLKGLRNNEMGRLVVVAGEFSGPRLSERSLDMMQEHVVASQSILRDQDAVLDDLSPGTYTAFFAAFNRRARSIRDAFTTMRVAYAIVVVTYKGEAIADLVVK